MCGWKLVLFICRIAIVVLFTTALEGKNFSTPSANGPPGASFIDLPGSTYRLANSTRLVSRYRPSEVELRIRNVGLGSALNQVRQRFGLPKSRRQESISDTTCGAPYLHLSLTYPGLTFGFDGPLKGSRFKV